ncbi:MinD/ParA family protein [Oscillospiraceae bacterium OttesenSCG-928-G22]|nr:MinD/ParA family protein [Oscillospiraceae bacterium OttesenSCG-928-G22]
MNDQATGLRDLVESKKYQESAVRNSARVLAVASGKGGVGKTFFSVNFALALQKLGRRVLIIDADFGLSNVDVMLGAVPEYNLSHVLKGERDILDIITEGPLGVRFISGGSGVSDLLTMSDEQLSDIVKQLLRLEDIADIIIFDAPAGISPNVLGIILASAETLIVTTPEPTSIMDAYALVKTAAGIGDVGRLRLVMNRCESQSEGETTMRRVSEIIQRYLKLRSEPFGYILLDPAVPRAVKQQKPVLLSQPKSMAAKNVEAMALKFLNHEEEEGKATGLRRFFDLFLRRKTI